MSIPENKSEFVGSRYSRLIGFTVRDLNISASTSANSSFPEAVVTFDLSWFPHGGKPCLTFNIVKPDIPEFKPLHIQINDEDYSEDGIEVKPADPTSEIDIGFLRPSNKNVAGFLQVVKTFSDDFVHLCHIFHSFEGLINEADDEAPKDAAPAPEDPAKDKSVRGNKKRKLNRGTSFWAAAHEYNPKTYPNKATVQNFFSMFKENPKNFIDAVHYASLDKEYFVWDRFGML